MEVALLFACLLWAILAPNPSHWLRGYFAAQLIYLPGVWIAYYLLGTDSPLYTLVYGLFTSSILVIVMRLAFDSLEKHRRKWRIVAGSLLVAFVALAIALWDQDGTHAWAAIQIMEAVALTFSACMMGFSIGEHNRTVPLSLCFLWFCQAGMRLGFVMNSSETVWLHANRWFPPAVACIGIAWLGVALRRESHWDGVT